MSNYIAVTKEPTWIKPLGLLCLFPGAFALIPFKVDAIQALDYYFYGITVFGVLLLMRASQRIAWRIVLEDNVVYYNKYNLFSSWKKRRAQEFALSVDKISSIDIGDKQITISYDPSKRLSFSARGLGGYSQARLEKLKQEIERQIKQ
jgi:hypothetical protein